MKNFLKKNKFKIIAVFLSLIIVFTLSIRAFGVKYESIDFNTRKSYC